MHSTVQTGLFTPNIYGYDFNYYHHGNHGNSNAHNSNHPPPPPSQHHHHSHSNLNLHASSEDTQNKKYNDNYTKTSFWQCTKPCGFMMLAIGIVLLIASVIGFLFHEVQSVCEVYQTCSNPTIKLLSVMALVFGILISLISFIIVVYSTKDAEANIIIAPKKDIDNTFEDMVEKQLLQNPHNSSKQIYMARDNSNHKLSSYNLAQQNETNINKSLSPSRNTINKSVNQYIDAEN